MMFGGRLENSYTRELSIDPLSDENECETGNHNQRTRPVHSGHFVRVAPTPLHEPYVVAVSEELALTLGLDVAELSSQRFLRIFSGNLEDSPGSGFESRGWATPYALSIYGDPVIPPGTGPRGDGYGDGRAISIGEVVLPDGVCDGSGGSGPGRIELQLKGGGKTPFSRGADGAAVLRSSVREFLASEAMHALGVPTTRALSLIASASPADVIMRPWYSAENDGEEPDIMQANRRAITTRVARSFLRVGQFELYGRRAARGERIGRKELEELARHALKREYPALVPAAGQPLQPALLAMLRAASVRFAELAAHWLRVGYVQSNFNADNCLVGGVTM